MTQYKNMSADALEAQYNLRARRGPDFEDIVERWVERSAKHRAAVGGQIDLNFGEGERDKLDWFSGGNPNGPALLYIHGGYWQRGDKSMYSFIAESFTKHGVSVAVTNYNLTPSVRIGQIPPQIQRAIAWLWHNASELGFSRDQFFVSGHSAGGHLTARMMATHWPAIDSQLPQDLIRGAIPISGLYELEPLVHTSINDGPQMDVEEARAESPCNIPPATIAPQLVVVGGGETEEFFRQADDYAEKFRTGERKMERYNVLNDDHFDELETWVKDDSEFFEKSMALILDS